MNENINNYIAGWIDSAGHIRFRTKECSYGKTISPVIEINYINDEQLDLFSEFASEYNFNFKIRERIEIYKWPDINSLLEVISEYLVRYYKISKYILDIYEPIKNNLRQDQLELERHMKFIDYLTPVNWSGDKIREFNNIDPNIDRINESISENTNTTDAYISAWFDNKMSFRLSVSENKDGNFSEYLANIYLAFCVSKISEKCSGIIIDWLNKNNIEYKISETVDSNFVITILKKDEMLKLFNIIGPKLIARRKDVIDYIEQIHPYYIENTNLDRYEDKRSFIEFIQSVENILKKDKRRKNKKYTSTFFEDKWFN